MVTATVIGDDVFGVDDRTLAGHAQRIARAVGSQLLAVTFARDTEWRFLSADPSPPLNATTAEALLRHAFVPADHDALCAVA